MKKLLVCSIAIALMLSFAGPSQAILRAELGVGIDDGGIGDVLLFSLYDVRVNVEDESPRSPAWENYLAIENTSGAWTAFHLRFRAWKKSIEVWDHVILLSPYDVFWMTLKRADDGVRLFSTDVETLKNSGLIWGDAIFWEDRFSKDLLAETGFCDGLAPDLVQHCFNEEMQAGHIEAIGLWSLTIPPSACDLGPQLAGQCTEDTHEITDLVKDVNKFLGPNNEPGINVYDIQDALFYEVWTATAYANAGSPLCNYSWFGQFCVYEGNGVVVDQAWPTNAIVIDSDNGCAEAADCFVHPANERYGADAGNVLTGVFYMPDADTGRFQMENFIALHDFRTDLNWLGPQPWERMYYSYSLADNPFLPEPGFNIDGGDDNAKGLRDSVYQNDAHWRHRDGFAGGGIFFPAGVQKWFYGWQHSNNIPGGVAFSGGDEFTYLWYYVQPNWATVAGPTLVDGDDFKGINWNDAQLWLGFKPWFFPKSNVPADLYGYKQPLGDKGVQGWETLSNSTGYFVHYFNDVFSLDDVENALGKGSIWSTYLRTRVDDGAKVNTNTDVVLTIPTKHHHWFFGDYPLMWRYDPEFLVNLDQNDWDRYLENVADYRGNSADRGKDVEEMVELFNDKDMSTIADNNQSGMTIAQWFEKQYDNGIVVAGSYMWDMEQNLCGEPGIPGPPPSPVPPTFNEQTIPHEVNIVRVGAYADTFRPEGHEGISSIGDAYELLNCILSAGYKTGHFMISSPVMVNGQRGVGQDMWPWSSYTTPETFLPFTGGYSIPVIGVVIVQNDLGVGPVTRSAMAEWHYTKWTWWLFDALGIEPANTGRDGLLDSVE